MTKKILLFLSLFLICGPVLASDINYAIDGSDTTIKAPSNYQLFSTDGQSNIFFFTAEKSTFEAGPFSTLTPILENFLVPKGYDVTLNSEKIDPTDVSCLNFSAECDASGKLRKPVDIVFVVDISGTMKEKNRIDKVKPALLWAVDRMDDDDRAALVTFGIEGKVISGFTKPSNLKKYINDLNAGEWLTNIGAGVKTAFGVFSSARQGAEKVAVILTDGVPNAVPKPSSGCVNGLFPPDARGAVGNKNICECNITYPVNDSNKCVQSAYDEAHKSWGLGIKLHSIGYAVETLKEYEGGKDALGMPVPQGAYSQAVKVIKNIAGTGGYQFSKQDSSIEFIKLFDEILDKYVTVEGEYCKDFTVEYEMPTGFDLQKNYGSVAPSKSGNTLIWRLGTVESGKKISFTFDIKGNKKISEFGEPTLNFVNKLGESIEEQIDDIGVRPELCETTFKEEPPFDYSGSCSRGIKYNDEECTATMTYTIYCNKEEESIYNSNYCEKINFKDNLPDHVFVKGSIKNKTCNYSAEDPCVYIVKAEEHDIEVEIDRLKIGDSVSFEIPVTLARQLETDVVETAFGLMEYKKFHRPDTTFKDTCKQDIEFKTCPPWPALSVNWNNKFDCQKGVTTMNFNCVSKAKDNYGCDDIKTYFSQIPPYVKPTKVIRGDAKIITKPDGTFDIEVTKDMPPNTQYQIQFEWEVDYKNIAEDKYFTEGFNADFNWRNKKRISAVLENEPQENLVPLCAVKFGQTECIDCNTFIYTYKITCQNTHSNCESTSLEFTLPPFVKLLSVGKNCPKAKEIGNNKYRIDMWWLNSGESIECKIKFALDDTQPAGKDPKLIATYMVDGKEFEKTETKIELPVDRLCEYYTLQGNLNDTNFKDICIKRYIVVLADASESMGYPGTTKIDENYYKYVRDLVKSTSLKFNTMSGYDPDCPNPDNIQVVPFYDGKAFQGTKGWVSRDTEYNKYFAGLSGMESRSNGLTNLDHALLMAKSKFTGVPKDATKIIFIVSDFLVNAYGDPSEVKQTQNMCGSYNGNLTISDIDITSKDKCIANTLQTARDISEMDPDNPIQIVAYPYHNNKPNKFLEDNLNRRADKVRVDDNNLADFAMAFAKKISNGKIATGFGSSLDKASEILQWGFNCQDTIISGTLPYNLFYKWGTFELMGKRYTPVEEAQKITTNKSQMSVDLGKINNNFYCEFQVTRYFGMNLPAIPDGTTARFKFECLGGIAPKDKYIDLRFIGRSLDDDGEKCEF